MQTLWPRLDGGLGKLVGFSGMRSGISLSKTAIGLDLSLGVRTIFLVVKARKTAIAAARNTSWVGTETFTVTTA